MEKWCNLKMLIGLLKRYLSQWCLKIFHLVKIIDKSCIIIIKTRTGKVWWPKRKNVLETGDKSSRIIYDRWLILRPKVSRNPRIQAMNISVRTKNGDFLLPWAKIKVISRAFPCCYYDVRHVVSLVVLRVMVPVWRNTFGRTLYVFPYKKIILRLFSKPLISQCLHCTYTLWRDLIQV